MKRMIACLSAGLLVTGCVAAKAPQSTPPERDSPPPMIAAAYYDALKANQPVLLAALEADKSSAGAVAFAGAPAPPKGFTAPFGNLRVVVFGGGDKAEQCISPSLPAAGDGQRAEGEDVYNRKAGTSTAAADRADYSVVGDESINASPPPDKLRMLTPAK